MRIFGFWAPSKPKVRFPISEIAGEKFSLSNERDSRGIQIESVNWNENLFVGYSPRSRFLLWVSMAVYIARLEQDQKKVRNELDILIYALKECGSPVDIKVDKLKDKMVVSPNWKSILVYAKAMSKLLNKNANGEKFDMKKVAKEVLFIFEKEDTPLHSGK